jgi:hypothetical protein
METVKETKDFKIFKKRNGRFGVKNDKGKWINGEDKVKILSPKVSSKSAFPKKWKSHQLKKLP